MSDLISRKAAPAKDINVPSNDIISRQAAIDAMLNMNVEHRVSWLDAVVDTLDELPPAEPDIDEWCTDCKEYDQEHHSCPRWNRVIRQTVEDLKAERRTDG